MLPRVKTLVLQSGALCFAALVALAAWVKLTRHPEPIVRLHREPAKWSWHMEAAWIGDIDGDGKAELALGFPWALPDSHFRGAVQVQSLDPSRVLWRVEGEEGQRLGLELEVAGDVDGDGCLDLLDGADSKTTERGSSTHLLSGRDGSRLRSFEHPPASSGCACVGGLDDLDGDGCADWIVCRSGPRAGVLEVVMQSSRSGSVIRSLQPEHPGQVLIAPVGAVGDLDGDGKRDCFANLSDPRGVSMHSSADGRQLWTIQAAYGSRRIASSGDVDGDGVDDVWIAIVAEQSVELHSGRSGQLLAVASIPKSEQIFSEFGASIARVPDLDRDGIDELLAGAPSHDGGNDEPVHTDRGKVYLFSGRTGERLGSMFGDHDEREMGMEVLAMPDLDGDGRPDLLCGAVRHGLTGGSYVEAAVYSSERMLE